MLELGWNEVLEKIAGVAPQHVPGVVLGIGRSGVIPAALVAARFKANFLIANYSLYHDPQAAGVPPKQKHEDPVLESFEGDVLGKNVLIVDDFAKTGRTLEAAKKMLLGRGVNSVQTLVVCGNKGAADFCLFESPACAVYPWQKR